MGSAAPGRSDRPNPPMKHVNHLLFGFCGAVGAIGCAVLSVQNAAPVSLNLLGMALVPIPLGLLLVLGVAGGLAIGAIAPIAWQALGPRSRR